MKNRFSIFEAKARLSEIIRIVQNRHEVIITDRSKPVVKVVPFEAKKTPSLEERVRELERSGQLVKPENPLTRPPQVKLERNILQKFLKERD